MICIDCKTSDGIFSVSRSISGKYLLIDFSAASLHKDLMSAPVYPCNSDDKSFRSISSLIGIPLVWISKISSRPSSFGTEISNSLSNLPGLRSAGSTLSGLFVAPKTITFPLSLRPSINAKIWATTLFSTSPYASSLFGAIASISSTKIILGELSLASLKISLNLASVSP